MRHTTISSFPMKCTSRAQTDYHYFLYRYLDVFFDFFLLDNFNLRSWGGSSEPPWDSISLLYASNGSVQCNRFDSGSRVSCSEVKPAHRMVKNSLMFLPTILCS